MKKLNNEQTNNTTEVKQGLTFSDILVKDIAGGKVAYQTGTTPDNKVYTFIKFIKYNNGLTIVNEHKKGIYIYPTYEDAINKCNGAFIGTKQIYLKELSNNPFTLDNIEWN